jgi:hypothetical protein
MKNNRTLKAMVVVFIVGIGLLRNINEQSFLYRQIKSAAVSMNNFTEKADSLPLSENQLLIYTIKITNSGIQHLISQI